MFNHYRKFDGDRTVKIELQHSCFQRAQGSSELTITLSLRLLLEHWKHDAQYDEFELS